MYWRLYSFNIMTISWIFHHANTQSCGWGSPKKWIHWIRAHFRILCWLSLDACWLTSDHPKGVGIVLTLCYYSVLLLDVYRATPTAARRQTSWRSSIFTKNMKISESTGEITNRLRQFHFFSSRPKHKVCRWLRTVPFASVPSQYRTLSTASVIAWEEEDVG